MYTVHSDRNPVVSHEIKCKVLVNKRNMHTVEESGL